MNPSRYIDEKDLPFTEDELFRAFALTDDEPVARDAAHMLAELLSSGTYDGGWSIADKGFAALALLSEELRERVDAYMGARWEGWRWMAVRAGYGAKGFRPTPSPRSPRFGRATKKLRGCVAEWRIGCAALAEWVRRRQAGEPVGDGPPPWPGTENEER